MMKRFMTLIASLILLASLCSRNLWAQSEWISQSSGTEMNLMSIDFLDAETGSTAFISGDAGTILKTQDGGNTWQLCNTGVYEILYHIDVVSENFVIACGSNGTLLRSFDGGDTWQLTQIPSSIPGIQLDLYSVSVNPVTGVGFVSGSAQNIHKTTDFGETWTVLREGYFGALYYLQMLSDNEVVVCGENSIFQSLIGRTLDGGENWDWRDFYPIDNSGMAWETETHDAHFFTLDTGLTVQLEPLNGTGFITPVYDWEEQMWPSLMQTEEFLTCLDMRFGRAIAGGGNIKTGGTVYLSPDFGVTWELSAMPDKTPFINDVYATANRYYAIGEGGSILVKDLTVGISQPEPQMPCILLYPNPAGPMGQITVISPYAEGGILEIYSASGSCVWKQDLNRGTETLISTGHLRPGIYIVRLKGREGVLSGRFVIAE